MADSENIGGISVSIGADYSALQTGIEKATQIAAAGGKEIAEALTSTANAASAAAHQLSLFDEATMVPYANAAGQLNMFADALEPIGGLANKATVAVKQMSEAEMTAAASAQHWANAHEQAKVAMEAFTNSAGALVTVGASITAAVTVPIVGLAAAAIHSAGAFEQTKIAFTTMLGSAQAATAMLEDLKKFALTTPFEFNDLTRASQRMMALGFEAKQVIPTLRSIGDAVAGLGGGAEMINRVTLALGQMQAKGKVSAEEMNQLAESGIKAWDMLAKSIGKSIPEAMKMAENGLISASEAIPALLDGMNKKFGGMMEAQSKTLLGSWSNIADKIEAVLKELGNALLPIAKDIVAALDPMIDGAMRMIKVFTELPEPVRMVVIAIVALAAAIGPIIVALGGLGFALANVQALMPVLIPALSAAGSAFAAIGAGITGAGASYTAMVATGLLTTGVWIALAGAIIYAANAYWEMRKAEDGAAQAQKESADATLKLEVALRRQGVQIDELAAKYRSGQISEMDYIRGLRDLVLEHQKAHPVLTAHGEALTAAFSTADAAKIKMKALGEAVASTRKDLEEATAKYNAHKATAADVAKAYDAWQGATAALKAAHTAVLPVVTSLHRELKEFVATQQRYVDAATAAADASAALGISVQAQTKAWIEAQGWFNEVLEKFNKGKATFGELTKASDLLKSATASLNKTMEDLAKEAAPEMGTWKKNIAEAAAAAQRLLPPLQALPKPIIDATGLMRDMGIAVSETGDLVGNKLVKAYIKLGDQQHTLEMEDAAWQKISNSVNKLAEVDLPAAMRLYDQHLRQVQELGGSEKALLDLRAQGLAINIAAAEQSGAAATSEIYNLEQVRLKQEALYNSTHALGDLAVAVERDMWEGWHMVMQGIADAILEGKNFGDTMEKVGRQVLKMIVDDLVNYAFKELKKAFIGVDSSIQQANKSWDKFMKSIADSMKPVAAKPGDAKTPGGKTPGGTLNTIGVIAEVATAISSIISNFQFAAMNKSLDIIVEHTLRIFNVLDQWYLASQDWFGQMFTRMGEIWRDMVIGFDDVVNALDGTRGSGGGGANPIPGRPGGGDRRPIGGDRDAPAPVTTYPTDTPPPIFTVPGVPFIPKNMPMSGPGAGTYAQAANNSQKIGDMTFNVFESANPRETARAIAGTLRQISPRFSAYST